MQAYYWRASLSQNVAPAGRAATTRDSGAGAGGRGRPGGHCCCWFLAQTCTSPESWARPNTLRGSPQHADGIAPWLLPSTRPQTQQNTKPFAVPLRTLDYSPRTLGLPFLRRLNWQHRCSCCPCGRRRRCSPCRHHRHRHDLPSRRAPLRAAVTRPCVSADAADAAVATDAPGEKRCKTASERGAASSSPLSSGAPLSQSRPSFPARHRMMGIVVLSHPRPP